MIDTTKLGIGGFGSPYGDPMMMQQQQAPNKANVYNTQYKSSTTRKPDGTTTESKSQSGGTPMYNQTYNPNAQLPQGFMGFQQPQGMTDAQGAYQNVLSNGGGTGYLNAFNNSFVPGMQYTINDAINQAMQKGSNTNMMGSSPMLRMQGDIAARAWAGIAPQLAQINLSEAGNSMDRYMRAGQAMEGNAMNQFNLGQTWSNNAMGMGNAYQAQQQGMLSPYQQEMARMYGENNPYYGLAMQGFNAQNAVAPIQYNPSGFSQVLNGALGLGSAWLMGGGGNPFSG